MLSQRLVELRRQRGLTQKQAVALTRREVSLSTWQYLEQGTGDVPKLVTLRAIARALGSTFEEIAGIPDPDAGAEDASTLLLDFPPGRYSAEQLARLRRLCKAVVNEFLDSEAIGDGVYEKHRGAKRRKV